MMNIGKVMQLKGAWEKFTANHPKFQPFLQAVSQNGLVEDTIYEMKVTTPDGQTLQTNIKLKKEDIDLLLSLKELV